MEKTYELKIAGLTRQLPVRRVSEHLSIALFNMFGDTELVEACAAELCKKLPSDVDYLVCPEAKSIPLTHALARLMKINYVVIRKTVKAYMHDPIITDVKSITTTAQQHLVLDHTDVEKIANKRVVILDDVVSTGGSIRAVEEILAQTECIIVAKAAVLLEDAGYKDDNLIVLDKLPVFPD